MAEKEGGRYVFGLRGKSGRKGFQKIFDLMEKKREEEGMILKRWG